MFVAKGDRVLGALLLADELRRETPRALQALRAAGVKRMVMVTGDRAEAAETISAALDLDAVLSDRSPSEKVEAVATEQSLKPTMMVGDGINDAPALASGNRRCRSQRHAAAHRLACQCFIRDEDIIARSRADAPSLRRKRPCRRSSRFRISTPMRRRSKRMQPCEEEGKTLRRYWTTACTASLLKPQCTTGPQRRVTRWEHEQVLEAVQRRLDENPEAMRVRRQTAEHPFGTLKARMGATHFLMKRLPKVATEMALHVLAYNLTRVMNIIGIKPLNIIAAI